MSRYGDIAPPHTLGKEQTQALVLVYNISILFGIEHLLYYYRQIFTDLLLVKQENQG